jgi:hypothetical protein
LGRAIHLIKYVFGKERSLTIGYPTTEEMNHRIQPLNSVTDPLQDNLPNRLEKGTFHKQMRGSL